jgi:hypothetical protein
MVYIELYKKNPGAFMAPGACDLFRILANVNAGFIAHQRQPAVV